MHQKNMLDNKIKIDIVRTFITQYLEFNHYDFEGSLGGSYAMHVRRLYGIDVNGHEYLLSETRENVEYNKDKDTLHMFEVDYNNMYAPKSNI